MGALRWARLRDNRRCGVRRGAWYRVLSVGPDEAVLEVNHAAMVLPRSALHIIDTRPTMWSIVERPSDAVMLPESWGTWYAVCPNCAERRPVQRAPGKMPCPRCKKAF
jgi:hypothetical protein